MAAAEKGKKCKHPSCTCTVTSGDYCSAQCEAVKETPDVECLCNHPGCGGRVE